MYTHPPLSVVGGITYQEQHLAQWKSVLKPEVYERLEAIATKDNDKAKTGYDIVRGQDLDTIVHNQLMSR